MSIGSSWSDRPLAVKQCQDVYTIQPWQHHHAAITVARNASGDERGELLDMLGLDLHQARRFERATYPGATEGATS